MSCKYLASHKVDTMLKRRKHAHSYTFLAFALTLLFLFSSPVFAVSWNVGNITLKDSDYNEPPFIKSNYLKSITVELINDTGELDNFTVQSTVYYSDNILSEENLSYIGDNVYRVVIDSRPVFKHDGKWRVNITASDESNNTLIKTDAFNVRNPVPLILFIVLGVVCLLLMLGGLNGNMLFGVLGVVLLFVLGFIVMQGQLAIPDGETIIVDNNTTITETSYDNWNTGKYHLVGMLTIITSVFMFLIFMMGGDK